MRINVVKSARKAQGLCEHCREMIEAGDSYQWIKGRYGPKRSRHASCPIWRASEMTDSKMSTAYAAQEQAHDDLSALEWMESPEAVIDEIKDILQATVEEAQATADDYQEGFDNMPEGLQYSASGEAIEEKIRALEDWVTELEQWTPETEEPLDGQSGEEWLEALVESVGSVIDGLSE